MNEFWIIITASLVAICTALLGSFLMLRKMAMVGDAISHAVLPGIVVAYLMSGSKVSLSLLFGATLTGLIATFIISLIAKKARIQNDAAIGITYTLLFAIGIILIEAGVSGNVDIDLDCVLYGDIALINLDKIIIDGNLYLGPRAFYVELLAFVIVLIAIILGYKGLKILSFNEEYAASLGIKVNRWHYFLMALVSLVTVLSFEVVGAVLVVGFLVIPPATAYLITDKLKSLLWLASGFGVLSVVIGFILADFLQVSITGMMIVASALLFGLVFIYHIISKRSRQKQISLVKEN